MPFVKRSDVTQVNVIRIRLKSKCDCETGLRVYTHTHTGKTNMVLRYFADLLVAQELHRIKIVILRGHATNKHMMCCTIKMIMSKSKRKSIITTDFT